MLIKVYISCLKRFRIFSNLFDSQRVGTPIKNRLTGVAVIVAVEKVVLIFLHLKWLDLAVIWCLQVTSYFILWRKESHILQLLEMFLYKKVTVNMVFGKIDRHLQRKSKEKEYESPVWQHIYFHHQAIAKKTWFNSIHILFIWMVGWVYVV